jgi:serine/threonine protein kinase
MPESRAEIIIQHGEKPLGRYFIKPGKYVIGRDSTCEIQVNWDDVSRRHAHLTFTPEYLEVEDLGSSSGTSIDGHWLKKPTRFQLPQQVIVGTAILNFQAAPEEVLVPATPAVVDAIDAVKAELKGRKYDVGYMLNQGAMGAIHQAMDLNIGRSVALKIILADEYASLSTVRRFVREARVLGMLDHPGIVPIYELAVNEQDQIYYTMKFVKGVTLKDVLAKLKTRDPETVASYPLSELLTIFQKVCDAVGFAHSKGVIHRDLKPENIMLGEFGQVLVMDWGLAKILAEGVEDFSPYRKRLFPPKKDDPEPAGTMEGEIMGTPQFMAPEQVEGRVNELDARTDIFALGGILYSILTLRPPFTGANLGEVFEKIRRGYLPPPIYFNQPRPAEMEEPAKAPKAPVKDAQGLRTAANPKGPRPLAPVVLPHCPNARIPEMLSEVTMKALANNPADRFQSVEDLQRAMQVKPRDWMSLFRQYRVAMVSAALVLLLGAGYLFSVRYNLAQARRAAPTFYAGARALHNTGEHQEALAQITQALKLRSGEADYHFLQGEILRALENYLEACRAYEATLKLDPQYPRAEQFLRRCQKLARESGSSE